MMNFLKRRWVVALLAVGAAYLAYKYIWPVIGGSKKAAAPAVPPANQPAPPSTQKNLAGPVRSN